MPLFRNYSVRCGLKRVNRTRHVCHEMVYSGSSIENDSRQQKAFSWIVISKNKLLSCSTWTVWEVPHAHQVLWWTAMWLYRVTRKRTADFFAILSFFSTDSRKGTQKRQMPAWAFHNGTNDDKKNRCHRRITWQGKCHWAITAISFSLR